MAAASARLPAGTSSPPAKLRNDAHMLRNAAQRADLARPHRIFGQQRQARGTVHGGESICRCGSQLENRGQRHGVSRAAAGTKNFSNPARTGDSAVVGSPRRSQASRQSLIAGRPGQAITRAPPNVMRVVSSATSSQPRRLNSAASVDFPRPEPHRSPRRYRALPDAPASPREMQLSALVNQGRAHRAVQEKPDGVRIGAVLGRDRDGAAIARQIARHARNVHQESTRPRLRMDADAHGTGQMFGKSGHDTDPRLRHRGQKGVQRHAPAPLRNSPTSRARSRPAACSRLALPAQIRSSTWRTRPTSKIAR